MVFAKRLVIVAIAAALNSAASAQQRPTVAPPPQSGGAERLAPVERTTPPSASGSAQPSNNMNRLSNALNPFSPEEIRQLQARDDEVRRAGAPVVRYVPRTSTEAVDLSSGSTPLLVRVGDYHGAYVSFIDAAGEPWPIRSIRNHNARDINVPEVAAGDSTFFIDIKNGYSSGGISVMLQGRDIPISISVVTGQKEADVGKVFRLPLRRPGGRVDPVPGLQAEGAATHDLTLLTVLSGIAPDGSRELKTTNPLVRAWLHGSSMLVRTTGIQVMSAFEQKQSHPDGTTAYRLAITPVVTISKDGALSMVGIDF